MFLCSNQALAANKELWTVRSQQANSQVAVRLIPALAVLEKSKKEKQRIYTERGEVQCTLLTSLKDRLEQENARKIVSNQTTHITQMI